MQSAVDGSTNKLLGVSLSDASKLLSLDGAKWDEGYTSVPLGQLRIYHFRGFYLLLNLQVLPRGITPDSPQPFSLDGESQLRSNGVWWVANFYPDLQIDGLTDPKKRMSNYWDKVHAGFRERNEEMKMSKSHPKSPSPDKYAWPERGTWPKDKGASKLLDDRFALASTNSLGTATDIVAIKKVIVTHKEKQEIEIHQIRWLNASLVMAFVRTESAAFYYVVEKKTNKWELVTYYMLWVS